MKFLCLCHYDAAQFATMTPEDGQRIAEICAPHDHALKATGRVDFIGSLALPEQSRTLRAAGGKVELEDGPFATAREPVGAFFLIEAEGMEEAVEIASMHPGAHIGHLFGGGIEIRPVEMLETPHLHA